MWLHASANHDAPSPLCAISWGKANRRPKKKKKKPQLRKTQREIGDVNTVQKQTPRRAHLLRIQCHSDRDQMYDVKAEVESLMYGVYCKSIIHSVVFKLLRFDSVSSACFWKKGNFFFPSTCCFSKKNNNNKKTHCLSHSNRVPENVCKLISEKKRKKKTYQGSVSTVSSKCKPQTENGRKKKSLSVKC